MKISKSVVKVTMQTIKTVVKKNSPKILAGLGIGFGVGSVGFAIKGTVKATEIIRNKKEEKGEPLTKKEIAENVWKEYVPVVALSVASAACIVGSVHISARRLAVMTAAYAMSEDSFKEYKNKVKEFIGEKKEEEVRGEIAQDFINSNPPKSVTVNSIIKAPNCLDRFTGQYFYSDADSIKRAINEVNNLLLHDFYVSVNELNMELGVPETSRLGDEFGWNVKNGELIEPEFTTELGPDGNPILVLDYVQGPYPHFRNYMDL